MPVKGNWDFPFYWRKLQRTKNQGGKWTVKFECLLRMELQCKEPIKHIHKSSKKQGAAAF